METDTAALEESFSFWKNLVLIIVFFTITPFTILTSLFSLYSLSKNANQSPSDTTVIQIPRSGVKVYASLPSNFPTISGEPQIDDARSEIVRQYLASYNSPLESLAPYIVQKADEYGLDYRLTTAIAQKESNLCRLIPPKSFNCWGWGIHSEGTLSFSSFEQGIDEVSKGLRQEYLDKGYQTPEEIMTKYTPLSNGSWAEGVNQFMAEMQ